MEWDEDSAMAQAVGRLLDEVDPWAVGGEITDAILLEIPELAGRADEDLRQAARAAAIRSLEDVWDAMRRRLPQDDIAPPDEGIAFADDMVRRGVDVEALLRAWRIGHSIVTRHWVAAAERVGIDSDLRQRVIKYAVDYSFVYVDVVSVRLAEEYAEERARWARGGTAMRAEMLREVLAGDPVPTGRATSVLGYDVTARHLAFILWADPESHGPQVVGALEETATEVAHEAGDGPTLMVSVGHWVVWGWVAVTAGTASGPAQLASMPAGVRVAFGTPAGGLGGFVRTHQQAMKARQLAGMVGRRAGAVVLHHNVALLALLTADADSARDFVKAELGSLATQDDGSSRLRATLRVYLDENSSPARTARRLGVNKNTVVYRVNRAQELLGRPIGDRRSELDAALRLVEVIDALGHTARDSEDTSLPADIRLWL